MKRRPGLRLAISKIFRILIVSLSMSGNPYWLYVPAHCYSLLYYTHTFIFCSVFAS